MIISLILIPLLTRGLGCGDVYAQFDPSNPPEPQMYYKLTTSASPSNAGYTSGDGDYLEGEEIWISTSARENWTFLYWVLNGVKYTEEQSFTYTMGKEKVDFIAYYAFNPNDPAEPSLNLKNRLYLTSSPEGCCSFNLTSGEKHDSDNYVYVEAFANQGYEFNGWYEKGILVSKDIGFNYYMTGSDNITLVAHFVYNPVNPDDPSSSGNDPIHLYGDANDDGVIDVADITVIAAYILGNNPIPFSFMNGDIDRDKAITVSDITSTASIILNNAKHEQELEMDE